MWIDRLDAQVQGRGLWVVRHAINSTRHCAIRPSRFWENPARIT